MNGRKRDSFRPSRRGVRLLAFVHPTPFIGTTPAAKSLRRAALSHTGRSARKARRGGRQYRPGSALSAETLEFQLLCVTLSFHGIAAPLGVKFLSSSYLISNGSLRIPVQRNVRAESGLLRMRFNPDLPQALLKRACLRCPWHREVMGP